jgi:hypothetical protein
VSEDLRPLEAVRLASTFREPAYPSPKETFSPRGSLGDVSSKRRGSPRAAVPSPRAERLPPLGPERTAFLRDLDRDPAVIAASVGFNVEPGENFRCALPAHAIDGNAQVEIRRRSVVYRCDCDSIDRNLTEVYFHRTTGTPRRLGRGEFVRWKVRLVIEAEVLAHPLIEIPALPNDPPDSVCRAYDGLRLLVAVRSHTDPPGESFTFARRFASEWCGLDRGEMREAISALLAAGVLVKVGDQRIGAHAAYLYEIGSAR